jgi:tetratricopeptide (TPR) repeat protein
MSYYVAGKYSEAVAALKTYVEHKPQDGTAWAVMGLSEFELKSYDNALFHLQRGQALGFGGSPESVRLANYTLGVLLNRQGEFKLASETLASAAGAGELGDKAQFALGMALLRMPFLPDQVDASKRPLVHSAGEIAALLQESKYDDAFAKFQSILKAYPATPFLHYAYGVALASLSQYEEAEAQMRLEAKISPGSELPFLRLSSIALRQHRPADALAPAQQAVKLSPSSGEAHYLLGRAYLELGDESKAVGELETAARLSPNSPEVHFNLAKAYGRAKQADKAEQERAIFVRLNTLAEQQRSLQGNQSYEGPRDSADVSAPKNESGVTPK